MFAHLIRFNSKVICAVWFQMAEKDWISKYFTPLATSGARNMNDDAGMLAEPKVWQIATTDALVEEVHFLKSQPIASVAEKLVRVNVSDLLAKGAKPVEGLLTLGWPDNRSEEELAEFAAALAADLLRYGIGLVGGDTVMSPTLFASLTLLGGPPVKNGQPVWQQGAQIGDEVLLTGRIGGCVGLNDALSGRSTPARSHYFSPELPPPESAELISRFASASTDVSDGLFADLLGILKQSNCGAEINLEAVRVWRETENRHDLVKQCTGGDDYQIVCTAEPEKAKSLVESEIFYPIGKITATPNLVVRHQGDIINLPETLGFEHGN